MTALGGLSTKESIEMNFRTRTTRQALATLGACFALLLLASPASAVPDGYQPQLSSQGPDAVDRYLAIHRAQEERQAAAEPTVIPYLSHGAGVTVGADGYPVAEPTVIPYLSHGIGIDDGNSPALLREQPDGFQPQLRGVDSAPVASPGFDWETTGFVAGGILAAMLLALMSTIALRERRGLRSA